MPPEPPITIYPSRRTLVHTLLWATPMLLVFLGLFGFTVYAASSGELPARTITEGLAAVVGVLFIIFGLWFFGYIAVYAAHRLLRRRPVLLIDGDGVVVHWASIPVERIPWNEIEAIAPWTVGGSLALNVVLRDREAFTRRLSRLPRWWLMALRLTSNPPISVRQSILPNDVHALAAQIRSAFGDRFQGPAPRPVLGTAPGTAIAIHLKKRELFAILAGCTALFAAGLFLVASDPGTGLRAVLITVAGYAMASFGAFAIYVARLLLARGPALVIDTDGILDRSSPLAVGLIRWSEIKSVGTRGYGNQRGLRITLRDPEAFMRRQPPLRRWLWTFERRFGSPDLGIAVRFLSMDVDTLVQILNRDYEVPVRAPKALVPFEPCRLEYDLSRRQRLAAHLGVWAPFLPLIAAGVAGLPVAIIVLGVLVSPWLLPLIFVPLFLGRRFISGLLNVLMVPLQHVEMTLEEHGLRYHTTSGWWTHGVEGDFQGIWDIRKYSRDTWTILARNGFVVSIPVAIIGPSHIEHIRAKAGLDLS